MKSSVELSSRSRVWRISCSVIIRTEALRFLIVLELAYAHMGIIKKQIDNEILKHKRREK